MELFRDVNVDWMGKAKYFVALSLILLAIGWASIWKNGGIKYGIDFRGGTLIYVRFAGAPPIDQLRKGLSDAGLADSTIQTISGDSLGSSANDIVIGLERKNQTDDSLDAGRQAILDVLHKTLGTSAQSGKADLNAATKDQVAAVLTQKDPLNLGVNAGDRYNALAGNLLSSRDKDHGGIVTNFDELRGVTDVTPAVTAALSSTYSLDNFTIRNVEVVGPKVGSQLRRQAILATLYALGGMLLYIAFRFEWVYGAAAVIAVFHDVLITLGLFSLTLSRTILTSGLTLLTVLVLFLMGGQVLRAFSFAMVVGVVVGTYSSFGIAAPIVVLWNRYRGDGNAARAGSAAEKRVLAPARR
jgi:preprotein translocase subunit SecF